jgi:hypothetical protein
MPSFSFTRVVVIESLSSGFMSGTYLRDYLVGLAEVNERAPPIDYYSVQSVEQFGELIRMLTSEARTHGEQYILHIETHGYEDKTGIVFANNSHILWEDLRYLLAPLNRETQFNLVVCVAACFGAHFLGELNIINPAPCCAIIGPTEITDGPELLGRFRDFYRQLFSTLDLTAAVTALLQDHLHKGGFLVQTAEDWFMRLVVGYVETLCTNEVLEQRASAIQAQALAEGKVITIEQFFEHVKKRNREFLDDYFRVFFMSDAVPENTERYADSLSQARQRINDFLDAQAF